jgi:acyl-homoserine-lactone acylase
MTRMGKRRFLRLPVAAVLAGLVLSPGCAFWRADPDAARWDQRAQRVTITRDDWGVPHVHGRTDADAVFGLVYAQAEDDFHRVEMNVLNALGRTAEADGESQVYRDLRMRLVVDEGEMRQRYAASPEWLRGLMSAWADGLNCFLATHSAVRPRVIKRFEPWMALAFSEGSIGWDIETVSLQGLESFYGRRVSGNSTAAAEDPARRQLRGSNGIAVAPARTEGGAALLLINPHTSFFFRAEAHVASDEGLNAYGAVTWGQFFVYQGFNERVGWMHTSTGADAIDEYAETIIERPGGVFYRYGGEERPVGTRRVSIGYRTASGGLARRDFTVLSTHHGPVVRAEGGKWVAVRLMQEPVKALMQSFLRTKAANYEAFRRVMDLHANSSNNTVYADADGTIAYFHANFVPKRDPRFDWTRPVDGSDPATDWQGVHSVDESPNVKNPASGWVQNTNNWPYSVAGPASPKAAAYPAYMDQAGESPRGVHALRVLSGQRRFTLDSLIAAAYDPYLTGFDYLLPPLFAAYRAEPASSPMKTRLAEQVEALRAWNRRWSVDSVPTTLAIYWGEELWDRMPPGTPRESLDVFRSIGATLGPRKLLEALAAATDRLTRDFGTWEAAWGEVNRFQRITGDIVQPFDDAAPSVPVGFTSGWWGSLAAFESKVYPGTRRRYGDGGNSFVAVVEFGKTVKAKAVTAGGESGNSASRHFNDQAARYAAGALRDVYFLRGDLEKHISREYRPGQ